MKTNQNMIRMMGNFEVVQRTKDGMFNMSLLLKQWNDLKKSKKELNDFLDNKKTKEFIKALDNRLEEKSEKSPTIIRGRGRGKYTWSHPYLFIKFAMWLNPKFEVQVIEFIYDELIKHRHNAGDNYKPFCKAINKIYPNCDFSEPAKWLNYVVFNNHEKDIRNKASQTQLEELSKLEKKYTELIEEGYLKTIVAVKQRLREEWHRRHSAMPALLG